MEGKLLLSHYKNVLVKCSSTLTSRCSHTICFVSKPRGGCQGSGIPIKVVHTAAKGEWWRWVSTCIPKVWPIISMYSQHHLHLHSTRFNPRWRKLGRLLSATNCNSTVSHPFDYRREVTLRWARPWGSWESTELRRQWSHLWRIIRRLLTDCGPPRGGSVPFTRI